LEERYCHTVDIRKLKKYGHLEVGISEAHSNVALVEKKSLTTIQTIVCAEAVCARCRPLFQMKIVEAKDKSPNWCFGWCRLFSFFTYDVKTFDFRPIINLRSRDQSRERRLMDVQFHD